jgi:hypothetical protein
VHCTARSLSRCLGVVVADIAGHARVLSKSGSAPCRAPGSAIVQWALAKRAVSGRAAGAVSLASVAVSETLHESQRELAVERALDVLSCPSGAV